ncbi:hypothetical protein [Tortoise microvirus 2]|nr:hypothetical protein [Tortoise microvirus 2]QCS37431.1 hypothetical protein [Tortoise microvirus 2]QPB07428.1 MAG: hypothetical protein [Microvirus sp.]
MSDFIPVDFFTDDGYAPVPVRYLASPETAEVFNRVMSMAPTFFPDLPVDANPVIAEQQYAMALVTLAVNFYFDTLGLLSPPEVAPSTPVGDDDLNIKESHV